MVLRESVTSTGIVMLEDGDVHAASIWKERDGTWFYHVFNAKHEVVASGSNIRHRRNAIGIAGNVYRQFAPNRRRRTDR